VARSFLIVALSLAVFPLVEGQHALAAEKTELAITAKYKDEPPVQHYWGADAEISAGANKWSNRPADSVYFSFQKKGNKPEESASLVFSTEKLEGRALRPGSYSWAQRAAFAEEGTPGIDIGVGAYGPNKLGGDFKVLSASYRRCAGVIIVTRFAATFQISAGFNSFKGHVYYHYDPDAPEPGFSFEQCPLAPSPRATEAPRSEQEPEHLPAYWRRALPVVVRALAGR
jgi:hypothetical protein